MTSINRVPPTYRPIKFDKKYIASKYIPIIRHTNKKTAVNKLKSGIFDSN